MKEKKKGKKKLVCTQKDEEPKVEDILLPSPQPHPGHSFPSSYSMSIRILETEGSTYWEVERYSRRSRYGRKAVRLAGTLER